MPSVSPTGPEVAVLQIQKRFIIYSSMSSVVSKKRERKAEA